jgi:hypothetical protein
MSERAEPVDADRAAGSDLADRLEALGRTIGEREAALADELGRAQATASDLHSLVSIAIDRFNQAARAAGSPHVEVRVGPVHVDDKHLRAVEFDLQRGRHRAIVTVKSRGDVTLVGPFHRGKTEGPCRTFPIEARPEIETALAEFLTGFVEEATTP